MSTPRLQDKRQRAHRYGMAAEKIAALWLRAKGYRILKERYRNHGGEIDILARKGKVVAVVEVKARQSRQECTYSITPAKQVRLSRAAQGLMSSAPAVAGLEDLHTCSIRFDVVWITPRQWPLHIKDAWRL